MRLRQKGVPTTSHEETKMDFEKSGLPRHSLVEEAFDYSHANMMANEKEALRDFAQQIDMIHAQHMMNLDMERKDSGMSEDAYLQQKKALEDMRDQQMKMGPHMVHEQLSLIFSARRVRPALEIAERAESPAPEVMAALLLLDAIRSPIDYRNIEGKFGTGVAGLIANLVHIDAYPTERPVTLGQADANVKSAYLALMISGLEQIIDQAAQAPGQHIFFPPGQESQIHDSFALMWGNDAKLDAHAVELFNKVAEMTSSEYRMEASGKDLLLVKGGFSAPKGPDFKPHVPKGPGGGGMGGDVF